jgi:Malic enzyme, N-terminal domain
MSDDSKVQFSDREALLYHAQGRPGKLEIVASKPMATQRDLSLAYSPGVAVPVRAIAADPAAAYDYTAKGNLVAVISNGTAILGLGNLGALASKPVMEGKAVLFKRFADVDSIDLEVDTEDPDAFINAVALLEPSFGGINLEDIAAPACFIIEAALKERLKIPVMIAVPCWSSCITGIFIRSRSVCSIMKHSGALISSRLMPPKLGSIIAMASISASGSSPPPVSSTPATSQGANFPR